MCRPPLAARTVVRLLFSVFILACDAPPSDDQAGEFTTVLLVRHAEKEFSGDDPGLTELGIERAAKLAHVAGEMGVIAVYSTQFQRTRATAIPLANQLGLDVSIVSARDTFAATMANIVLTQHVGEVVAIVSHSNTVPTIIEALGAKSVPVIEDDEYDDLYIVIIAPSGRVHLVPLRYGRETP